MKSTVTCNRVFLHCGVTEVTDLRTLFLFPRQDFVDDDSFIHSLFFNVQHFQSDFSFPLKTFYFITVTVFYHVYTADTSSQHCSFYKLLIS